MIQKVGFIQADEDVLFIMKDTLKGNWRLCFKSWM